MSEDYFKYSRAFYERLEKYTDGNGYAAPSKILDCLLVTLRNENIFLQEFQQPTSPWNFSHDKEFFNDASRCMTPMAFCKCVYNGIEIPFEIYASNDGRIFQDWICFRFRYATYSFDEFVMFIKEGITNKMILYNFDIRNQSDPWFIRPQVYGTLNISQI